MIDYYPFVGHPHHSFIYRSKSTSIPFNHMPSIIVDAPYTLLSFFDIWITIVYVFAIQLIIIYTNKQKTLFCMIIIRKRL